MICCCCCFYFSDALSISRLSNLLPTYPTTHTFFTIVDCNLLILLSSVLLKWRARHHWDRNKDKGRQERGSREKLEEILYVLSYCRQCQMDHHPPPLPSQGNSILKPIRAHTHTHPIWIIAFVHWILLLFFIQLILLLIITIYYLVVVWLLSSSIAHHPCASGAVVGDDDMIPNICIPHTYIAVAFAVDMWMGGVFTMWPNTTQWTQQSNCYDTFIYLFLPLDVK